MQSENERGPELVNEDPPRGRGELMRADYGRLSAVDRSSQSSALEAAAVAEVMVAARLAQMNPRNWLDCRARILKSCGNFLFADAAIYAKPVGGEKKRGFSVRFAEECVRQLGNMKVQISQVADFPDSRVVKVLVWDVETCTSISQDVTVMKRLERRDKSGRVVVGERKNRDGQTVYIVEATDDEMRMIENREVSFAFRNVVLRLVREDLQLEAWDACEKTIRTKVTSDPEAELKAVCDGFRGLNIMPVQLEQRLGHKLADTSPAEILELRHDYKALRDGETTWAAIVEQAEERRTARAASNRTAAAMPSTPPASAADKMRPAEADKQPRARRERRGRRDEPTEDGGKATERGARDEAERPTAESAATNRAPDAQPSDPVAAAFDAARAALRDLADRRFGPDEAEGRLDAVSMALMGRRGSELRTVSEVKTVTDVIRTSSDVELERLVTGR